MRTIISLLALTSATLLDGALPANAAPGDEIGAAVRIVNLVTGSYDEDKRNLATGDNVRQDELIEVSADGIGEIRLNDETKLALGPGARLKLDQFVYDPDISGGAIILSLVRGAFRFITGVAAKPAYVIRTPTAAITVRGTIFDVYVEENGISWLLLIEGAIEACNERELCKVLDEPGKLIRITPDGFVSDPAVWPDLPTGGLPVKTAFPFIVTPPEIDPGPELTPEEIVDGRVPDGPPDADEDDKDAGDNGREPPHSGPPLLCWNGWKEVPRGWHKDGWRVKHRRRGHRVLRCAHRVEPSPGGDGGGVGIPLPPKCHGGKTTLLKTLPPRWRCICPDGKKRHRVGPHAFLCKGKHGGGPSPGPSPSAKDKCLKKGWTWTGSHCIPTLGKCQKGAIGKWPNCKRIVKPLKTCPLGTHGKPPHCKKLTLKPHKKNQVQDRKRTLEKLKLQKQKTEKD
jgi:hypothetical protein